MDFSDALRALNAGAKISRTGWNGQGMWVVRQKGYPECIPANANTAQATGLPEGTVCTFLPYAMLRTAGGEFVPWVISQTDLFAEDWQQV
ncbi:DUF2829 domain-containing protein [Streptomyces sp. AD55]|uniref:DUF2829 domain-containing protein n=1 Tax=Streptomyces sp. AD55 TaxID=3242895 RepID=UPI0035280498